MVSLRSDSTSDFASGRVVAVGVGVADSQAEDLEEGADGAVVLKA